MNEFDKKKIFDLGRSKSFMNGLGDILHMMIQI